MRVELDLASPVNRPIGQALRQMHVPMVVTFVR
jgi:hypothetical protein